MGAYVYSLRGPKHVTEIVLPDGRAVLAGQLKYSHKPRFCWGGETEPLWQRLANARIAKMELTWNGLTPEFVIVVGDNGPEEGQGVLNWHRFTMGQGERAMEVTDTDAVSTYDDPNWGGRKTVGLLKRVGKSWHVTPVEHPSC